MSISKLNSKAWADMSKISGVTKSWISYVDGIAAPASAYSPYAMSLNWSNEYYERTSASNWGIANTWTIGRAANYSSLTGIMFDMRPVTWTANIIAIEWSWWPVTIHRVSIFKSTWATLKDWRSFGTPSTGVRMCLIVTRDWTNLKIYLDWVEDTTWTKSTDSSWSMTNTSRKLSFGTNLAHTQFLSGDVHSMRIASSVWTADECAEVGGWWYANDLRSDFGDYASSANLEHYYLFWYNDADSGNDYQGTLDLTPTNISSADLVSFW